MIINTELLRDLIGIEFDAKIDRVKNKTDERQIEKEGERLFDLIGEFEQLAKMYLPKGKNNNE